MTRIIDLNTGLTPDQLETQYNVSLHRHLEHQRLRFNAIDSPRRTSAAVFDSSFQVFPVSGWKERDNVAVFWLADRVAFDITTVFCRIAEHYWVMRQPEGLSFEEVVALVKSSDPHFSETTTQESTPAEMVL